MVYSGKVLYTCIWGPEGERENKIEIIFEDLKIYWLRGVQNWLKKYCNRFKKYYEH